MGSKCINVISRCVMVVQSQKLWVNLIWKKVPGPVQHRNVTISKQVLWRGFRKIARFLTAPRTFPVLLCPPQSWRAFSQVLAPSNSCPLVYLWHLPLLKSCLQLHFAEQLSKYSPANSWPMLPGRLSWALTDSSAAKGGYVTYIF